MNKLLYIEASPRKSRSYSIQLARTFLDRLSTKQPTLAIDTLDLWAAELPRFDGPILDAKYALLQGDSPSGEQIEAWRSVTDVIDRFNAADLYVISTPMWNFGVPYKLKHLIDVIAQPTLTYQAKRDAPYGEWGLLTDKKAVVISARGGAYPADSGLEAWDFQGRYLEYVLNFIGVKDVSSVAVELTAIDADTLPDRVKAASDELAAIADRLA